MKTISENKEFEVIKAERSSDHFVQYLNQDEQIQYFGKLSFINSSLLENELPIYLPLKRIKQSKINKRFNENNRILEIPSEHFDKVEIRGRLLGQHHKDIMEILLSYQKRFSKSEHSFNVVFTAYNIKKQLRKNITKQQVIQHLKEITEFRLNTYSTINGKHKIDYNFGFIDSVSLTDDTTIKVRFTQEYTYFLAKTKGLHYSDYIEDIIAIDQKAKEWSQELKLKSHKINPDFLKAIVRYMINHNGNNSQIKIDNLIEKLNFKNLISAEHLNNYITDLRRENVRNYLQEKFGISLTNDDKTLTFQALEDKKKYIVSGKIDNKKGNSNV